MLAGVVHFVNIQPREEVPIVEEKRMYAILFRVEVKQGKRQELIDFMIWDCQVVREMEPATLRFDVLEDPEDEDAFFIYEAYKNEPFQHWSSVLKDEVIADFKLLFVGRPICSPAEEFYP